MSQERVMAVYLHVRFDDEAAIEKQLLTLRSVMATLIGESGDGMLCLDVKAEMLPPPKQGSTL